MTLPLAHVGHYLWILYLLPVGIVIAGIVHSKRQEKKQIRISNGPSPPRDTIRPDPGKPSPRQ